MVLVQASKFTLPNPSLSSPPHTTSILFEPNSLSLALIHSDSSLSLYPSFSPHSPSSSSSSNFPTPQTLIPSPSSSSTFLLLQSSNPNSTSRVLFIVSGPHRAGSQILLRFYILQKNKAFSRSQVICSQKDLRFEPKLGVLLNVKHGVSIKLAGSVNYFAMYSVSSSKIWVFAVKMEGGDEGGDGVVVKLMRCAVIECSKPIWSVSISFGFLLLGEENGVRVFSLRRLVKGRVKKVKNLNPKSEDRGLRLPNGVIARDYGKHGGRDRGGKQYGAEGVLEVTCNGELEGKIEKHCTIVKPTNVKFRHDRDGGACFVALKRNEVATISMKKVSMSVKAISIQALSQRMFLILDSDGDLHLLCLSNSGIGVDITGHVRQLPHNMKVQNLAILTDITTVSQTVWISDGCHSVHLFTAMDIENALNSTDGNDDDEKLMHLPVNQVVFSSEKIQDIVSVASNAILILGQGTLVTSPCSESSRYWSSLKIDKILGLVKYLRGSKVLELEFFNGLKPTCPARLVMVYLQDHMSPTLENVGCQILFVAHSCGGGGNRMVACRGTKQGLIEKARSWQLGCSPCCKIVSMKLQLPHFRYISGGIIGDIL